jgi:cell division protein FtsW
VKERFRWRIGVEARALVLVTATILAFGLAVLYSASSMSAVEEHHSNAFYLLRQLSGVGIGIIAFAIAAKIDAERWYKWAWPLMGVTLALMLITILPFTRSIAPVIHGSRRFLIGSSIQPSEIGRFAVVIWSAMLVVKKGPQLHRLTKGFLPFLVVVGALDVLVVMEPDLSTALLYTLLMTVILFAGGIRIGFLLVLLVIGAPVLWHEAQRLQYVFARLVSFANAGPNVTAINYQLRQSLIAVGSGRLLGVGYGHGHQQGGFVPFPYDDFIGSVIGEEWGFVGVVFVVVAFAVWAWLGMSVAREARSQFLQLVAIGITFSVTVCAFLHLGVVIGLLPTTGLTLPFVSYGRSDLVLSMFLTGLLVNIGSVREKVIVNTATDPHAVVAP